MMILPGLYQCAVLDILLSYAVLQPSWIQIQVIDKLDALSLRTGGWFKNPHVLQAVRLVVGQVLAEQLVVYHEEGGQLVAWGIQL